MSEIARLMAQIRAEYEAAQRGLFGLASGTSRHDIINAKMQHIGEQVNKLRELGGDEAVKTMLTQLTEEKQ